MNNCYLLEEKIKYICKCEYKFFFQKANVIGVGLGYKEKGGFRIPQKCISVFVTNKIPENQLSMHNIIPKYYRSISTDVVITKKLEFLSFNKKIRPVPGGYSIGSTKQGFEGTMGCIVTDGGHWHILSCCHIIAQYGLATLGTSVVQPARKFGGKIGRDNIAYLSKYIPLKFTTNTQNVKNTENTVDCAMAEVHNRALVDPKIALLGGIKGVTHATLGQNVQKSGENSELTTGKILSLAVTIIAPSKYGDILFTNQIRTTAMAKPGDSGAILLDMNMRAIGLCISGNNSESFFNSMQEVLKKLDVKIVFG